MDFYRPILEKALLPALQAVRGRPTVPHLQYMQSTETWPPEALRELQAGLLHRLIRHAYAHTEHYRALLDDRRLHPNDFAHVSDLRNLPLLERDVVNETLEARTSSVPPHSVARTATSGTTGTPVVVKYDAESRDWRDATRWRGYGWAGYRTGMRAMHYWAEPPAPDSWVDRGKLALGRRLNRDLHVDCVVRSEPALANAVHELERFEPQVIVAYAGGAAALARFVNERGLRRWADIPVIVGAERLWPYERAQINAAFGPVFETYACREVMLIGAECEAHDGLHTSMENLIVEVVVREPDGTVRAAHPGESGEVAVTDLHNLACPLIRYLTGDLAIAHPEAYCECGRGLSKVGSIQRRVTEALHDGRGAPVDAPVDADQIALTPAGKRDLVVPDRRPHAPA